MRVFPTTIDAKSNRKRWSVDNQMLARAPDISAQHGQANGARSHDIANNSAL
jgi:hypothetical protein